MGVSQLNDQRILAAATGGRFDAVARTYSSQVFKCISDEYGCVRASATWHLVIDLKNGFHDPVTVGYPI